MRIQIDSLKYANMLKTKGFSSMAAEHLMSTLTKIEIHNLYSKAEVDKMLSESVQEVFFQQNEKVKGIFAQQHEKLAEQRREFDARMLEQRREFDTRMQSLEKYHDQQLRDNKNELLVSRRWLIGTVITVGLSLAAYASTLLHFSH